MNTSKNPNNIPEQKNNTPEENPTTTRAQKAPYEYIDNLNSKLGAAAPPPPVLVAEIGCNHKGDMDIAKEMIYIAHTFAKANVVKFQKRTISECLTEEEFNTPHPVPYNAYGPTYGEHRQALEFTIEQHAELKSFAEGLGITYASSVWDLTSAAEITELNPSIIKVPSACNSNADLLEFLCLHFPGEIHLSLGMTSHAEESLIMDIFSRFERTEDLVLFACTSGYPISANEVCLLEISRLRNLYDHQVKAIGFSGHHLGIAIDIAAYTLGASYIERHFTLDRTWKGTDHAASLEPDGLRRLVRDLHATYSALTFKSEEILDIELAQRQKLKWNRHLCS